MEFSQPVCKRGARHFQTATKKKQKKTRFFPFSLQLTDKHTVTILSRTIQPEEDSNPRLIPPANLGLSMSCQRCQTRLKSILSSVF